MAPHPSAARLMQVNLLGIAATEGSLARWRSDRKPIQTPIRLRETSNKLSADQSWVVRSGALNDEDGLVPRGMIRSLSR